MAKVQGRVHWLFFARGLAREAEFQTSVRPGVEGLTFLAEAAGLRGTPSASAELTVDWRDLERLQQPETLLRVAVEAVNNELRDRVATRH